jgi:hypothetical protein
MKATITGRLDVERIRKDFPILQREISPAKGWFTSIQLLLLKNHWL